MKRATSILFAVILAATLTICTAKAAHADTRTRFGATYNPTQHPQQPSSRPTGPRASCATWRSGPLGKTRAMLLWYAPDWPVDPAAVEGFYTGKGCP